jgi:hypothetical protein
MRDYYADFLQNKISVNTLPKAVSKVSKGQNLDTKQAFDTFDTALPGINQKIYVPKNNNDLADFKSEKLHETLNRFITDGITFDVSADDFQMIDPAERLKASDKEFLKLNGAAILCTLQQALLMKQLSLDDLRMFKDEINERTAILSDGAKISPPFEIIAEVSREWFADLLLKL